MKNGILTLWNLMQKPDLNLNLPVESHEKQYVHLCEVTDVIHGKLLTYSWSYKGYAGISYVTFELFPQGSKTLLKLTHPGLETFPESNPDFNAVNFVQGWDSIINRSLSAYLNNSFTASEILKD